ncbi:MAG TPA: hypothetical protein VGI54_01375 [Solirubrobacteraceae bacterium]|jgi:Flp pilus assembly pilin Flp
MQDIAIRTYIALTTTPGHVARRAAQRLRTEDGQTSVEWLGIMVVIVALIAIAAASGFMTDAATAIKDGVVKEIKAVTGS